jgi:acyl-coenzyme A thioesterase 9
MTDSYCEALLPFRSDADLLADYVNIFGGIRFGKVLEDLSSSMQVTLAVESDVAEDGETRLQAGQWRLAAVAKFIMVARTPDSKHPLPVNPVIPVGRRQEQLVMQGQAAADKRRHRKAQSRSPPSAEESRIIHDMFLAAKGPNNAMSGSKGPKTTKPFHPMSDTVLTTVRVCHPQERNLHDLMFGGILMREAFELAFAAASLYCRGRPLFRAIDELAFVHPVPIGSILQFTATIVYTAVEGDSKSGNSELIVHVETPRWTCYQCSRKRMPRR